MTETIPTNNAGGPYNDEQAKHVRPEHDPRRWAEKDVHTVDTLGKQPS